jgi:carboxypeptidase C (cathepsin A)
LLPAELRLAGPALLALALAAWTPAPLPAQPAGAGTDPAEGAEAPQADVDTAGAQLPEARTTRHELALPGRTLAFEATAGSLALTDDDGAPEARIAYVAYALDAPEGAQRPVTFVVNGGPGAASAYLHLGVLGPWILPMDAERIVPSQDIALRPNPDTWLDFTDLVFVDPVGTGFSRLIDDSERMRRRYLSVRGDIDALAEFVRRWLVANDRLAAPTHFVGESYGGFRGPLLAETLQTDFGLALEGAVLLSPVLDFGWWQQPDYAPLPSVSLLPSLAAAALEEAGTFSPSALREAEAYASGQYVTDLLEGVGDAAAVDRIVERVTELTGLDRDFVARASGRIGRDAFARELLRDEGLLASPYDTTIAAADPDPGAAWPRAFDAVLDAMTAPLTRAMLAHYGETLDWLPQRRYLLLNSGVNRAWEWGSGRGQPEAVGALARVLALDPGFETLVAHGYTDLVTPYFASELILRQLPPADPPGRVRLETYRGGHMFYLREESRRAFRSDARALYAPEGG